jgi:hypothetical protein
MHFVCGFVICFRESCSQNKTQILYCTYCLRTSLFCGTVSENFWVLVKWREQSVWEAAVLWKQDFTYIWTLRNNLRQAEYYYECNKRYLRLHFTVNFFIMQNRRTVSYSLQMTVARLCMFVGLSWVHLQSRSSQVMVEMDSEFWKHENEGYINQSWRSIYCLWQLSHGKCPCGLCNKSKPNTQVAILLFRLTNSFF